MYFCLPDTGAEPVLTLISTNKDGFIKTMVKTGVAHVLSEYTCNALAYYIHESTFTYNPFYTCRRDLTVGWNTRL